MEEIQNLNFDPLYWEVPCLLELTFKTAAGDMDDPKNVLLKLIAF